MVNSEAVPERYKTLFNMAPVGFVTIDRKGVILEVNSFIAKLFGATTDNLIRRNILELISGDSHQTFLTWLHTTTPGAPPAELEIILNGDQCQIFQTQCFCITSANGEEFILSLLDITFRRQADERMHGLTQKLRDLAAHIEAGMEQEKKSIAREIHDGVGSSLTALKMELSIIQRQLKPEACDPEVESHIRSMSELLDATVDMVRKLATQLRPGVLDELGLISTLRWYSADFEKRNGITARVTVYPKDFNLDLGISTAVFRIFQEIMNNVAKHSKATNVIIFLRKQQHQFTMRVRDNGIGISEDEAGNRRSFGIIGIQERVKLLKGKIKINGIKNNGTNIEIEIPLTGAQ